MSGTSKRRPRNTSWLGSSVLLCVVLSGCYDACNGCGSGLGKDAAEKLTGSVDHLVDALPGLLAQIDSTIANNIGKVDEALAHQIQEVNKLLKENIDGINAALRDTIRGVDAMLAARLQQIFDFATGFLKDLDDVFAKRINQLGYNLEKLIKALELSGSELLETAGFQVVRTIREGNKVVAVIVGGVIETVVITTAAIVMVLVVVLAGIFYLRRRRQSPDDRPKLVAWQLGLGAGFFGLVFVVASLMVFVPSVRASVASARVTIAEEGVCPDIVPLAGAFVGEHRAIAPGGLTEAQNQEGAKLLGGLYQCMAQGAIADLRAKAREYAATIERLIGAATRCRRNEECRAAEGEHCQVTTGLCTARCEGPQQCNAGLLCHSPDTIGVCGPACSAQNPCAAGLTCSARGECVPPSVSGGGTGSSGGGKPGRFIPGGGHIKDILIKPSLGCPGPDCPIVVCKACGLIDPVTDRPVTDRPVIRPGRGEVKDVRFNDMGRFFDPRIRSGGIRTDVPVVRGGP